MTTQNLKRKKNNNLKDPKRTRASKNPAIVTPLSAKQINNRAEEALQESEERYRDLIETARDVIFTISPQGVFTSFNRAFETKTGWSINEWIGKPFIDLVDPNDVLKMLQRFKRIMEGQLGEPLELGIRTKYGGVIHGEFVASPQVKNGKAIGLLGIARDITERKRAEEALRQESLFRNAIIEHAAEGLCVCHETVELPHVAFTVWNNRMTEITGYSMDEINRLGWYQTMYPDPEVQARTIERMARMRQGNDIMGEEWEITRADGEKRLLSISTSVLQTGDGIAHILALTQDITEHKRAEEALRQSEEKYRTILVNIEDAYYEVDLLGNLTFFNDSLCRLVGYSEEELMGINNRQLTDPENAQKLYQEFNKVYRTGGSSKVFDWEIIKKDGMKRNVEASVSLIKDSRRHSIGFRGIVRDITERKQKEEEVRHTLSLLNATLESTADGILVVDRVGKIESFNQKFVQMWRIPKSIIASQDDDQALTFVLDQLKDPEGFLAKVRELYSQQEAESFDFIEFKDGRVFERYSQPQWIGEQSVGRVWSFRDVTERKKTEEALRTEKQRFQTLSEQAPFGMVMIDQDGTFKYMNPKFRELFGYDLTDVPTGKTWFRKAYPDPTYRHQVISDWVNDLERSKPGEKRSRVFTATCKDGTEKIANFISVQLEKGEHLMACEDITEHRRADEALRESESRLRIILDSIQAGILIIDPETHTIVDLNPAAVKLIGAPKEKIVNSICHQYICPAEMGKCPITDLKQNIENRERILLTANGESHPIIKTVFPIVMGGRKYLLETFIDIAEHKRAEDALRESEERYRNILSNIEDGYYEIDISGNFNFFNNSLCKILGYPKEEIMGMNNRVYMDKETARRVYHAYNQVFTTGEPLKGFGYKIIRKDGIERFVESHVSLLTNAKGERIGFRGIARDMSERKQAEENLKESEEKYRLLVEESIQGIVIAQGVPPRLVFANPAMTMILGYTFEELSSLSPKEIEALTHPEDRAFFFKNYKDRLEGKSVPPHYELRGIRKDGTVVWLELSSVRIEYKGQPAVQAAFLDITERKRAEEALRESEERYRTILEDIEDGYYEVDLAGNFTFFNDSLCRMLDYPRDEMIGMGNQQYTDEENSKNLFQAFNEVYRKGVPVKGFDWEVIRKDGTKGFGEVSVSLIKDSKGQPIGFRGIARDITKRKQAEEALRTEKQRFQALTENSPFGMVMIDQDGTFKYINPKFRELFGYDLTDIPDGKTWFRKAYPNSTYRRNVIEAWINDLKSSKPGEKRSQIFTVTCKDGTEKTINFIPVQLVTGENLMACEDITERKQAEEALSESEERFRAMTVTAADAITVMDDQGCIAYWNPAAARMFGYTPQEAIGKGLHLFLAPERYHEAYQNGFEKFRNTGQGPAINNTIEFIALRKDGTEFPMEVSTSAFKLKGQWHAVGIIRDITERKRAEEEMRALEEQFRQSQKMEAVGRLGGGIAHDFNNLLTIIKGYSQLSLLDLKENDPLWGNIQEIQKATQRATDLTRQLLAFSRRQILDLKVLDLNALLKDLDKMLRRIIGEDIELVTLLDGDLGRVKIDPGQIEQVVLNLAVNARDAMPSGGKLTIETVNVELDDKYAETHMGVTPGHYVRLSVSDTGAGMSQQVKEKIFEPFFTTKEKGKGTGLGLSMVYGIVKQSSGNIWVYSEPGHGTTFKIYLPKVEEELDTLHGRDETEFSPRGSETVLLVEDEQEVRLLAHRLLSQQGYRVLEATNGVEALHVAQEHGGEKIHLLLTDVVMPQMGGKELAEKLKILRPDIKVLYTSGYTDDAIVHHGILERGTYFLQKPFSLKTLSHKVREVLGR